MFVPEELVVFVHRLCFSPSKLSRTDLLGLERVRRKHTIKVVVNQLGHTTTFTLPLCLLLTISELKFESVSFNSTRNQPVETRMSLFMNASWSLRWGSADFNIWWTKLSCYLQSKGLNPCSWTLYWISQRVGLNGNWCCCPSHNDNWQRIFCKKWIKSMGNKELLYYWLIWV